jgi:thiamine-phosphate pyrophosphorylase
MYLGGVCFITDRKSSNLPYEAMVYKVLQGGVKWVQYREKERSRREIFEDAERLRKLTKNYNATLIVNDYVDIAICVDADGVHLGHDDLPMSEARKIVGRNKIIGVSTHSLEQAVEAERGGADYIGFGPVLHTMTKDAGSPKGIDMLREVKNQVTIPVVAIGGINLSNIRSVLITGVDAVAVASAILKGDAEQNAKLFIEAVKSSSFSLQR